MPDSLPTPDADAAYPTAVPEFDGAPELRVDTASGHTYSPRYEKERVWPSTRMQADEAGTNDIVWAFYNRFRVDELEVDHHEWRVVDGTAEQRTTPLGDGMCIREQLVVEEEYRYRFALVSQFYEQWSIDTGLEAYYETLLGAGGGAGSVALTGAGLYGTIKYDAAAAAIATGAAKSSTGALGGAAGGSLAAAGGAVAVLATAVGVFLGTTAVMREVKSEVDVESDGWAAIGKFRYDEVSTGERRETWQRIGEPFECPPAVVPPVVPPAGVAPAVAPGATKSGTSSRPLPLFQRWWFWALIALVVLVIAFVAIINSAGAPAPDPEPADDSVVDQPVALTVAPIETTCSAVTHSPPPGTATSPSWVLVALMIIAITQAPIDVGTPVSITVDGSDTTPIETEVGSNGTVTATVPISSYGTYEVTEIAVGSDGEQVSAPGPLPVIEVTAQEQPVTCSGPGAAVLEEAAQQHEP